MTWVKSMLQDGVDSSVSSKRVITLLAFVLCALAFVCNLFYGLKIEAFIYESMSYIAMTGLGVTVAEKFVNKQPHQSTSYTQSFQQQFESFPQSVNNTTYSRRGTPLPKQEDPLL